MCIYLTACAYLTACMCIYLTATMSKFSVKNLKVFVYLVAIVALATLIFTVSLDKLPRIELSTLSYWPISSVKKPEVTTVNSSVSGGNLLAGVTALQLNSNVTEEEQTSTSISVTDHLNSVSLGDGILRDMQRCSSAMGVSVDVHTGELQRIANKSAIFLRTFWEVVPKKYLSAVRNPCWYSNLTIAEDDGKMLASHLGQYRNTLPKASITTLYRDIFTKRRSKQRLFCLPHFLIAGFPKSGTTTLHSVLAHHPQVSPPSLKEPHWWARVPLGDMNSKYLKLVVVRYLLHFMSASRSISEHHNVVTYDGSQSTLIDSNFNIDDEDYCAMATVLHRVLPRAKMLVVMRDPVLRLLSHFYYMHNQERPWPAEMEANPQLYFHKYVTAAIEEFKVCLTTKSLYECANKKAFRKQLRAWLGVGVYHIQLLEWMQFWPRENFLFLKTEWLAAAPASVLRNITDFLALDPVSTETALKWSSSKSNVGHYKHNMLQETRGLLEDFYAPYNKQLEELIGISWTYPDSTLTTLPQANDN